MPYLQFFVYLEDQTNVMAWDLLGPVSVEFFERKVDGTDVQLLAGIEGSGAYATSLAISGATQLFEHEQPLGNISGTSGGEGVLVSRWKPWAEVFTQYIAVTLPTTPFPTPGHRRVRKRIEIQRTIPQGNFDLYLVVKRTIDGIDREIGRSELFRNCQNDLSDISPPNGESAVWIGVRSIGQERLPLVAGVAGGVEYERVREQTETILRNEVAILSGLSDLAIAEVSAQSVGGLDAIGLPPDTPAKKLFDPDSNNMHDLKVHGLRLAREADLRQRKVGIEQATRDRSALVAALKTGFECQQWTQDAAKASRFHWWIPVDPAVWIPGDSNATIRVEVYSIPAPTLEVPAAYFYAISRDLESLTPSLERYNLAAGAIEDNLRVRFRQAQIRELIGPQHPRSPTVPWPPARLSIIASPRADCMVCRG
ncbi:hypothetical protein U8P80_20025 [Rhizobium beringeri]|nr:hypothetical protein U8P80_20025 [Rhizobium beringeri]WSH13868.1 hypothetical protein U8P74_20025 [Rhizobium beringeri]